MKFPKDYVFLALSEPLENWERNPKKYPKYINYRYTVDDNFKRIISDLTFYPLFFNLPCHLYLISAKCFPRFDIFINSTGNLFTGSVQKHKPMTVDTALPESEQPVWARNIDSCEGHIIPYLQTLLDLVETESIAHVCIR